MSFPLENLYPDNDPELVFPQPDPVSATVTTADPLSVSDWDVLSLEQFEGEISDPEDQPDLDTGDADRAIRSEL